MTSADVACAFLSAWVVHACSQSDITSDRGYQFVLEHWTVLARSRLGLQVHHTTAYHLQANGLFECIHQSLKAALLAALSDSKWVDHLLWFKLGLQTVQTTYLNYN